MANALTRSIAAGAIDSNDAKSAWQRIAAIEVTLDGLKDGPAVIAVARKLQRQNAYDASYIALAQELGAEVWTLDGPLARNAAGADLPVRLIELPKQPDSEAEAVAPEPNTRATVARPLSAALADQFGDCRRVAHSAC